MRSERPLLESALVTGGHRRARSTTRVVLVESDNLFRDLLRISLSQYDGLEVVGAFASGEAALASVPRLQPEVVVLDIELKGNANGIQVGMLLRRQLPKLGIVLLTNHSDMRLVAALQKHVIKGWSYLLKRSVNDVDALSRAIEGAAEGYVLLDPEFAGRGIRKAGGPLAKLSARQREILALMAEGYTNAAIADRLMLAQKSVENQINQIYHTLGYGRTEVDYQPRVQAVLSYLRDADVYVTDRVRDSIA